MCLSAAVIISLLSTIEKTWEIFLFQAADNFTVTWDTQYSAPSSVGTVFGLRISLLKMYMSFSKVAFAKYKA
jgi:hypothetical protein